MKPLKEIKMKAHPILSAVGPGYPDRLELDKFPFYFEFTGTPYNDGLSYGKACKNALQKILDDDRKNSLWGWDSLSKKEMKLIIASAEKIMEFYPDYREELRGIAYGAEIPFKDMLLALLPEACISIGKIPFGRPEACTFCAYHDEDKIIIGNNQDSPPRYTIMHIKREGKFSYITVFYLGRIWGGGPSMNEHGLTLAAVSIPPNIVNSWEKMITFGKKIPQGKGTSGYIEQRRILENAKTVKEALSLLEERENLFRSTGLLIADAQGDLAIVSMTTGIYSVYRPAEKRFAWPNICFDKEFIKKSMGMTMEEYKKTVDKTKLERFGFLTSHFLNDKNAVNMESMWKLMRTQPYVCRKSTAITAVMNPKTREFFVTQGNSPEQPRYNLKASKLLY